jgi:hypothetical protein
LFDCKVSQMHRYKVSFIKNSLKALANSTKVAIRVAETGIKFHFLSNQFYKSNQIFIK